MVLGPAVLCAEVDTPCLLDGIGSLQFTAKEGASNRVTLSLTMWARPRQMHCDPLPSIDLFPTTVPP